MFREVSRDKRQIMPKDDCLEILEQSSAGVLSVLGDDDYPYGVPISYAYSDGKLYFHCAVKGHKLDSIKKHSKVSFTIIETDDLKPAEFTTYYRSVIVFGKARIAEDIPEKKKALVLLLEKYCPEHMKGGMEEIDAKVNALSIIAIDVEHISGKEAIEFAEMR
ncbi:MAG: pyridoxamine 5'-phosphate oxidase family protein [Anaerovoracaceae bacterium]